MFCPLGALEGMGSDLKVFLSFLWVWLHANTPRPHLSKVRHGVRIPRQSCPLEALYAAQQYH